MKTINLSKALGNRILKDMEIVSKSKDWNEVESIYDYYSSLFATKMIPLFGEDGSVALEHDLYNYHFKGDPEKLFKIAVKEQWEKYLVVGGFAHWIYLKMEELDSI